jgi:hypothetical protein
MAERIEIKSITTPIGTLAAAPLVTALNWRQGYPVRIEIRFPPGPSGLVGFQLAHSGEVIIPKDKTEFLITDNEIVIWPLDNFPYNAVYTARTFNTDVYSHTIQLRMAFNEVGTHLLTPVGVPDIMPPWPSVPGG